MTYKVNKSSEPRVIHGNPMNLSCVNRMFVSDEEMFDADGLFN